MDIETIRTYVSIISDTFVIIGGIIAVIQIWEHRRNTKIEIERHKKETTILYLNEILTKLSDLDDEIIKIFDEEKQISPEDSRMDSQMKSTIKDFLKSLERLCVGINCDVYDFDIVSRIIGTGLIKTWERLERIIFDKRIRNQNENLYYEFELVVNKLRYVRNKQLQLKEE